MITVCSTCTVLVLYVQFSATVPVAVQVPGTYIGNCTCTRRYKYCRFYALLPVQ